jgi:hypothetical protein
MASMVSEITIKNEIRPCMVNGEKALFHGWGSTCNHCRNSDGLECYMPTTVGIIERESGVMEICFPADVTFTDGLFTQYAFRSE